MINPPARLANRSNDSRAEPPIRLMIVDDSAVARAVISRMVGAMDGLEVVATAGSALEAIGALASLRVDIILLDIEMPGASGLEALPRILAAGRGARVLILSSMAEAGAEVTVRALAEGAADTLPKPGSGFFAGRFARVLGERIRRIGRVDPAAVDRIHPSPVLPIRLRAMPQAPLACLAMGASTGGLHALVEFLKALPERLGAPLLVTQHLPPVFMPHFAQQLQNACGRASRVAHDGQMLIDDMIHIAPGDAHLCLAAGPSGVRVRLSREKSSSRCLPSVDPMIVSVAEHYGEEAVAVILSGMGRDGLVGSRRLVERGGAVLAQDAASAVVWGMPRAVAEAGLASAVLPPRQLALHVAERAKVTSCR